MPFGSYQVSPEDARAIREGEFPADEHAHTMVEGELPKLLERLGK